MMPDRVAITTLTAFGSLVGHHGGDFLAQDDCMAAHKQCRDEAGRRTSKANRELALHAGTYAAAQAATKAVLYRAAGVQVPLLAQLAGAVVEGLLHAVIDDGQLLKRFSRIGKGCARFTAEDGTQRGRQQYFHDNVPGGRMLLDQAVHHQVQIPAGVLTTVAVAVLLARRAR